jgi:hypothetical protein
MTDLNIAFDKINRYSASGVDRIPFKFLPRLTHNRQKLLNMFKVVSRNVILSGFLPGSFKSARLHFVEKASGMGLRPIAIAKIKYHAYMTFYGRND